MIKMNMINRLCCQWLTDGIFVATGNIVSLCKFVLLFLLSIYSIYAITTQLFILKSVHFTKLVLVRNNWLDEIDDEIQDKYRTCTSDDYCEHGIL